MYAILSPNRTIQDLSIDTAATSPLNEDRAVLLVVYGEDYDRVLRDRGYTDEPQIRICESHFDMLENTEEVSWSE